MSESRVKVIINPSINSGGEGAKAWTQAMVELENGETVRIFQPVVEGDEVESKQNGQYTNWVVKKKTRQTNTEVMEALRKLYSLNAEILKKVNLLLNGDETEPAEPVWPVDPPKQSATAADIQAERAITPEAPPRYEDLKDTNGQSIPF